MPTPSRPTPAVDLELFARAIQHPPLPAELRSKIRVLIGSIAISAETPASRAATVGLAPLAAGRLAWARPTRAELAARLDQVVTLNDTEFQWVDKITAAVLAGRFDATTDPGQPAVEVSGRAALAGFTLNGPDGTYNRMVDMLEEAEQVAAVDRLTGPDLARVVFATYVMLGALRVARWARLERFVPQLTKTDNGEAGQR